MPPASGWLQDSSGSALVLSRSAIGHLLGLYTWENQSDFGNHFLMTLRNVLSIKNQICIRIRCVTAEARCGCWPFLFLYIIITAFLNNKRSHGKKWGYVSIVTFVSWSRLIAIVSRPSNVLKCVPQFIPNGAFLFPGKWIRNWPPHLQSCHSSFFLFQRF